MDPGLVACMRQAEGWIAGKHVRLRERKLAYALAINRWFDDWDFPLPPSCRPNHAAQ